MQRETVENHLRSKEENDYLLLNKIKKLEEELRESNRLKEMYEMDLQEVKFEKSQIEQKYISMEKRYMEMKMAGLLKPGSKSLFAPIVSPNSYVGVVKTPSENIEDVVISSDSPVSRNFLFRYLQEQERKIMEFEKKALKLPPLIKKNQELRNTISESEKELEKNRTLKNKCNVLENQLKGLKVLRTKTSVVEKKLEESKNQLIERDLIIKKLESNGRYSTKLLESELEGFKKEIERKNDEVEQWKKTCQGQNNLMKRIENSRGKLNEEIRHLKTQRLEFEKTVTKLKQEHTSKCRENNLIIAELENEIEVRRIGNEELKEKFVIVEKECTEMKENNSLEKRKTFQILTDMKQKRDFFESKVFDLQSELETSFKKMTQKDESLNELQKELTEKKVKIAELTNSSGSLNLEMNSRIMEEKTRLSDKLKDLESEKKLLQEKYSVQESTLNEVMSKLTLSENNSLLQEKKIESITQRMQFQQNENRRELDSLKKNHNEKLLRMEEQREELRTTFSESQQTKNELIRELRQNLIKLTEDRNNIANEKNEAVNRLQSLLREANEKGRSSVSKIRENMEELRIKFNSTRSEFDKQVKELEREVLKKENEIRFSRGELSRVENELVQKNEEIDKLKEVISEGDNIGRKIEDLAKERNLWKIEREFLNKKVESLEKENSEIKQEIIGKNEKSDYDKNSQFSIMQESMDEKSSLIRELRNRIEVMTLERKNVEEKRNLEIEEKEIEISSCTTLMNDLERNLLSKDKEITILRNKVNDLESKNREGEIKITYFEENIQNEKLSNEKKIEEYRGMISEMREKTDRTLQVARSNVVDLEKKLLIMEQKYKSLKESLNNTIDDNKKKQALVDEMNRKIMQVLARENSLIDNHHVEFNRKNTSNEAEKEKLLAELKKLTENHLWEKRKVEEISEDLNKIKGVNVLISQQLQRETGEREHEKKLLEGKSELLSKEIMNLKISNEKLITQLKENYARELEEVKLKNKEISEFKEMRVKENEKKHQLFVDQLEKEISEKKSLIESQNGVILEKEKLCLSQQNLIEDQIGKNETLDNKIKELEIQLSESKFKLQRVKSQNEENVPSFENTLKELERKSRESLTKKNDYLKELEFKLDESGRKNDELVNVQKIFQAKVENLSRELQQSKIENDQQKEVNLHRIEMFRKEIYTVKTSNERLINLLKENSRKEVDQCVLKAKELCEVKDVQIQELRNQYQVLFKKFEVEISEKNDLLKKLRKEIDEKEQFCVSQQNLLESQIRRNEVLEKNAKEIDTQLQELQKLKDSTSEKLPSLEISLKEMEVDSKDKLSRKDILIKDLEEELENSKLRIKELLDEQKGNLLDIQSLQQKLDIARREKNHEKKLLDQKILMLQREIEISKSSYERFITELNESFQRELEDSKLRGKELYEEKEIQLREMFEKLEKDCEEKKQILSEKEKFCYSQQKLIEAQIGRIGTLEKNIRELDVQLSEKNAQIEKFQEFSEDRVISLEKNLKEVEIEKENLLMEKDNLIKDFRNKLEISEAKSEELLNENNKNLLTIQSLSQKLENGNNQIKINFENHGKVLTAKNEIINSLTEQIKHSSEESIRLYEEKTQTIRELSEKNSLQTQEYDQLRIRFENLLENKGEFVKQSEDSIAELLVNCAKKDNEIANLGRERDEYMKKLELQNGMVGELTGEKDILQNDLESCRVEFNSQKTKIEGVNEQLRSANSKNDRLQISVAELSEKCNGLDKENFVLSEDVNSKEKRISSLRDELLNSRKELEVSFSKHEEEVMDLSNSHQVEVQNLKEIISSKNLTIEGKYEQLSELKDHHTDKSKIFLNDVESLRCQVEELEKKLSDTEESLRVEVESNKNLKSIIEEKNFEILDIKRGFLVKETAKSNEISVLFNKFQELEESQKNIEKSYQGKQKEIENSFQIEVDESIEMQNRIEKLESKLREEIRFSKDATIELEETYKSTIEGNNLEIADLRKELEENDIVSDNVQVLEEELQKKEDSFFELENQLLESQTKSFVLDKEKSELFGKISELNAKVLSSSFELNKVRTLKMKRKNPNNNLPMKILQKEIMFLKKENKILRKDKDKKMEKLVEKLNGDFDKIQDVYEDFLATTSMISNDSSKSGSFVLNDGVLLSPIVRKKKSPQRKKLR